MLEILKAWKQNGLIRSIDHHFGKFIAELGGDPLMQLSAALTSCYLGGGHICLPISDISIITNDKCKAMGFDFKEFCLEQNLQSLLGDEKEIEANLLASNCIGENAPIRLEFGALYLARYAIFEQIIADNFTESSDIENTNIGEMDTKESFLIEEPIKAELNRLFAPNYKFIWEAYASDKSADIKQLAIKYLDLIELDSYEGTHVDLNKINKLFADAKSFEDLEPLNELIPNSMRCDWQKVSAALALTTKRCVISGGPGTGKTTTVTKLLALLIKAQPNLIIKMVAPTGKAAARLTASINDALLSLDIPTDLKDKIPTDASTIHRLLGVQGKSNHFRANAQNKLNLDLLLVDEASMVDLPLMAKLLTALPSHARVILLGDKDQLASVEAGAVLGDICYFINQGYSFEKANLLSELTGFETLAHTDEQIKENSALTEKSTMCDHLCLLRKSYRFDMYSGIGTLATAVNSGNITAVIITKLIDKFDDLNHFLSNEEGLKVLESLILEGYKPYLEKLKTSIDTDVKELLNLFGEFQILCAVREGVFGVSGINKLSETVLKKAGLIKYNGFENSRVSNDELLGIWYEGRPIMVTQNNYHLGLYNGDIGICLRSAEGKLRVYFQISDGTIADFQPSRLPTHETVFAMTVHKSQGSEFDHSVLVLPEKHQAVVTRELIYTGITRAKKRLTLICDLSLMSNEIKHKTVRSSRLVDRLRKKD